MSMYLVVIVVVVIIIELSHCMLSVHVLKSFIFVYFKKWVLTSYW